MPKEYETQNWTRTHWELLLYCDYITSNNNPELNINLLDVNRDRKNSSEVSDNRAKDDLDILQDLESKGLIHNISTIERPVIVLTQDGYKCINLLRKFTYNGGKIEEFNLYNIADESDKQH
jgi:hypothetical protein